MAMRPSYLRRASTTEVYTALRLRLNDKFKGTVEFTTAAALLNAALAHGVGGYKGPGGDHAALIHRHRTAISLYYLAIDIVLHPSSSNIVSRPSHSHDSYSEIGDHESLETAYQQHLHHQYPRLFGSGLLQELIPLQPDLHASSTVQKSESLDVEVYGEVGSAERLSLDSSSTSQYFDTPESHAKEFVMIRYVSDPVPFLSPATTLQSHTIGLSLPSLSHQPHSQHSSFPSHSSSDNLRVPCYPLLLIEEAHSLAKFISSLNLEKGIAAAVDSFVATCRNQGGRDKKLFKHDLREVLKFFNVSHVIRLRHFENVPPPLGFDNGNFKVYARFAMSEETRKFAREALTIFERFDDNLAWIVAREEAKWPRWLETTSENDHCDVYVEDAAKKLLGEWKEITELLKILLDTTSLAAHMPVSRQSLNGGRRSSF
ncbi:hypothetical protein JCM3765_003595 [Sporobolomyces pararoseus]